MQAGPARVDTAVMGLTERAFVITLPRRVDRRVHVEALSAIVPGLEVVEGVDGREMAERGRWLSSAGAWGNRESHRRVLEHAYAEGAGSVLVFEDDARVSADFPAALGRLLARLPADWEAVMLGGEHVKHPTCVSGGVLRCTRTIRTHAYLVRGDGITTALHAARQAASHWDHLLSRLLGERARTYAPDPFLVTVVPSPSDIPDSTTLRVHYRLY